MSSISTGSCRIACHSCFLFTITDASFNSIGNACLPKIVARTQKNWIRTEAKKHDLTMETCGKYLKFITNMFLELVWFVVAWTWQKDPRKEVMISNFDNSPSCGKKKHLRTCTDGDKQWTVGGLPHHSTTLMCKLNCNGIPVLSCKQV